MSDVTTKLKLRILVDVAVTVTVGLGVSVCVGVNVTAGVSVAGKEGVSVIADCAGVHAVANNKNTPKTMIHRFKIIPKAYAELLGLFFHYTESDGYCSQVDKFGDFHILRYN